MAQSKSFFGNRRGSTKSHTYQVNGGQQITKDRVEEVKNPRTSAQMIHRCCLHTLSDAHAYLRPFIGRFWEGAQSPAASLAAFRKANYPILRAAAESSDLHFSFSPFKQSTRPFGLFQISNGSLNILPIYFRRITSSVTSFVVTLVGSVATNVKWSQFLQANGWQVGDIVHFIAFPWKNDTASLYPSLISIKVLNATDLVGTQLTFEQCYSVIRCVGVSIDRVVGSMDGWMRLSLYFKSAYYNRNHMRWAVLLERRVNGNTCFTPATITEAADWYLSPSFAEAIATYPQGAGNVLDGGPV